MSNWVERYARAERSGFSRDGEAEALDAEGLELAGALRAELPGSKIRYFSNAHLRYLDPA